MNSENASDFKRVFRQFSRAERAIKRNERLTLSTPTPAINQLRYAGRHILSALQSDDSKQWAKAENHCTRAWYDAFDGILLYQLRVIADFENAGYPKDAVCHYFPEYPEKLALIRDVQKLFRRGKMAQEMNLPALVGHLNAARRLAPIVAKLSAASTELSKLKGELAAQREESERNARTRRDVIAFVATVAGALIGWFGSCLTLDTFWERLVFTAIMATVIAGVCWCLLRLCGKPTSTR